jgi:hypothetical protein
VLGVHVKQMVEVESHVLHPVNPVGQVVCAESVMKMERKKQITRKYLVFILGKNRVLLSVLRSYCFLYLIPAQFYF